MRPVFILQLSGLLSGLTEAIKIRTNSPVIVVVGKRALLNIEFESQQPPHVSWALSTTFASWDVGQNDTPSISSEFKDRLFINTSRASIAILQTTLADSRNYTLTLSALDEPSQSEIVTLRAYELISNVKVTAPMGDVKEGDAKATLTCTMATGTWDRLTWEKDGMSIAGDAHMVMASDQLTIQGVVRGDAGIYACFVQNPFSNGTFQTRLTIYHGPDIPTISFASPTDLDPARFVLVNSTVRLTCATSSEPPAQYYWSVGESGDTSVPSDQVLTLTRVQLDQAGPYSCIVINTKLGQSVRKTVTLTVYELPRGQPSCAMASVADQRVLQFSCSWFGGVPAAEVRWLGLSSAVSAPSQLVYNQTTASSLDKKNITCVANHSAAIKYCTVQPVAPSVTPSRRVARETQGDATVTLRCEVRSNPPSTIHWFKGQRELRSGGKISVSRNSSEILIRDFSALNDTGNYSCSCRNPLGEERPFIILTAPQITATVRRLNGTAASIAWAVRASDVVTSFLVQSQSSPQRSLPTSSRSSSPSSRSSRSSSPSSPSSPSSRSSPWLTLHEAGMSERSATLTQLHQDQGYSFRVLPLTGSQLGEASPVQSVAPTVVNRLSGGAIAGIAVGCVLGALILLLFLILLFIAHKKKKTGTEKPAAKEKERPSEWGSTLQTESKLPAPVGASVTQASAGIPQRSISNKTDLNTEDWDRESSMSPKSFYLDAPYAVSNWRSWDRKPPASISDTAPSPDRMQPGPSSSQSPLDSPTLTLQQRRATMV